MALKTFGKIHLSPSKKTWEISELEPHVSIKLKAVFEYIRKTEFKNFSVDNKPEQCRDLLWFIERYPLSISESDLEFLKLGANTHMRSVEEAEAILAPNRTPIKICLKEPYKLRDYQSQFVELFGIKKQMINGDAISLGKTLEGIGAIVQFGHPAIVVCQSHLPSQWKAQIEKFTNLRAHIATKVKPYTIEEDFDVLIIPYSKIYGWTHAIVQGPFKGFFKSVTFDEIQELRHKDTAKYQAAYAISREVEYVLGLTATPVYNYGIEAFNIFDLVKPGCLGERGDFIREWCQGGDSVKDPKALGSYLRSNHYFLRRTRADVKGQLQDLEEANRVQIFVDINQKELEKIEERAKVLAQRIFTGTFEERGDASRQFDMMLRLATGVAKATNVAEVVKLILNDEEKVLLVGWHRSVYEIWMKELAEFNPVMYTGSETAVQKDKSKAAFISGESRVMILSLRSGVGLDGLQDVCSSLVFGELDWSPAIHEQVIGRLRRDGQEDQVQAYFCLAQEGSDPAMIGVLGLKSAQAQGITDPFAAAQIVTSDDSRIKEMARSFLTTKGVAIKEQPAKKKWSEPA